MRLQKHRNKLLAKKVHAIEKIDKVLYGDERHSLFARKAEQNSETTNT